jgi:hypothetical protein
MAQIIINGNILSNEEIQIPFSGIRIELWDKTLNATDSSISYTPGLQPVPPQPASQGLPLTIQNTGAGWIASTISDIKGNFTFIIDDPASELIVNSETIVYRLYKNNLFIYEGPIGNINDFIPILLRANIFDVALNDNLDDIKSTIVKFTGQVFDVNGMPIDQATINVYENGFRVKTFLAAGSTDLYGKYEVKVNTKSIGNSSVLVARSIRIEVVDAYNDFLAASDNIFSWQTSDEIITNFSTQYINAISEFERITNSINAIIGSGGVPIGYLIVDPSTNTDEIAYVAGAIGMTRSAIELMVVTYHTATVESFDTGLLYSLTSVTGTNLSLLAYINEQTIRDTISSAIGNNLIPTYYTQSEIDAFVEAIKTYQIGQAKLIGIIDEDYTIDAVYLSFFPTPQDIDNFLIAYNIQYSTLEDFWLAYTSQYGPSLSATVQLGFKMVMITNYQPQMISAILSALNGQDISVLATWTEQYWASLIAQTCTATQRLCVPACIRQGATDPNDQAVQAAYAKILLGISQSLYPMSYINNQLQDGNIGPKLIPDQSTRTEVITFISNNLTFDSRTTTVYEINAHEWNLSGITDIVLLQNGLLPFQRLLRVAGGNPVAICAMVMDNVTSSRDIVRMGWDGFRENYSSLFLSASLVSYKSLAATMLSSSSGSGIGTTALATYSAASSVVSSTAGSLAATYADAGVYVLGGSSIYVDSPIAVPFPTAPVTGNPTLVALFGNLDYCICCDCKSVYSPAAYLSDTLKFLQSTSTGVTNDVYSALQTIRPDIINVDLTCANSDTPMPYIDLVNEILEIRLAVNNDIALPPNFSFQTSCTADQLAAYPEHTYKDSDNNYQDFTAFYSYGVSSYSEIYRQLSVAVYPGILPFSMPIEESRVYLQHLGISRLDLMKLLCPVNQLPYTPPVYNAITDFSIHSEWLGISEVAATIVTGAHAYCVAGEDYYFYGSASATVSFPDPTNPTDSTANLTGQWVNVLSSRIDVLLQQTGISYSELLQYLTTDYLNPADGTGARAIGITVVTTTPATPVDTCHLNLLQLSFTGCSGVEPKDCAIANAFFKYLHRFIRLANTGKFSIYQWDILLRSMKVGDAISTSTGTPINESVFQQMGRILLMTDQLNLAPEILAMWWNDTDITQYLDYPNNSTTLLSSVYQNIFNNKNVINSTIDNAFSNPLNFGTATYAGNTAQIANFCGIPEAEVVLLLTYLAVPLYNPVSLDILSRLYILSQLAQSWYYSISDFLTVLTAAGITVYNLPIGSFGDLSGRLDNLQYCIDTFEAISNSPFSLAQLNYIISGTDPADPVAPNPGNIELFYENLRAELFKYPLYNPLLPDEDLLAKLKNIIYQHYSKEFGITQQLVYDIFTAAPGSSIINNLITSDFISPDYPLSEDNLAYIDTLSPPGSAITYPPGDVGYSVPHFKLLPFYYWYRFFFKTTLVINKAQLRTSEFEYLFFNTLGLGFDFKQFPIYATGSPATNFTVSGTPVSVSSEDALYGLLRLGRIIQIIQQQSLPPDALGKLMDATQGIITPTLPGVPVPAPVTDLPGLNICFENFLAVINQDGWNDMLYEVVGNTVTSFSASASGNTENSMVAPAVPSLLAMNFTELSSSTDTSDFSFTSYANITSLSNVIQIMYWCKTIGLTPTTVQQLLRDDITTQDSRSLIIAARGKYDDSSWAKIAKPLRDIVRVKQRDALVAFQQMPADLLYGYVLIDTQMDTSMITSRIKQAISSVQLFIDRVVLGLVRVPGDPSTVLTMTLGAINEWQKWRKWYGIWEANRKIFFYPEDWMEPELRDDKTELFTALETSLNQNPVTDETAQTVITSYLESLNEIARLEPVGTCDQTNLDGSVTTHVFSRTNGSNPVTYHRTLQGGIWSAWEKMDIKIQGSHIVPYVWQNRLYVFWLTFAQKQAAFTPSMESINSAISTDLYFAVAYLSLSSSYTASEVGWLYNDQSAPNMDYASGGNSGSNNTYTQFDLTLNWTEYKNSKWQNQQVGKETMTIKTNPWLQYELNNYVYPNNATEKQLFNSLMNNGQLSVMDLFQSRFYLQPYVQSVGMANPISSSGAAVVDGDLYLMVLFPTYLNLSYSVHSEYADYIKSFHFSDSSNKFEVTQNLMFYERLLPPASLAYKNMSLVTYNDDPMASVSLNFQNDYIQSSVNILDYDTNASVTGLLNTGISSSTAILGKSMSKYKLFTKPGYYNPLEDKFMYEDIFNTFFVQKLTVDYSLVPGSTSAVYSGVSGPSGPPTSSGYSAIQYFFQTFYHPHVGAFISMLNEYGVDGLMRPDLLNLTDLPIIQDQLDTLNFPDNYLPNTTQVVDTTAYPFPTDIVDFSTMGSYSIYNWEVFYHIPMLIAGRLTDNQQFADAQKWYHYIFDPTSLSTLNGIAPTTNSQRYWKFMPFFQLAGSPIESIDDLLADINANLASAMAQVSASDNDPFEPYAIARLRPIAFMKNVLMKYLDNLIAWGDYLFSQDTIESINEATQLYILASSILGPKPVAVPQRAQTYSYTFKQLDALGVDAIGDAEVAVEGYIDPSIAPVSSGTGTSVIPDVFYFCLAPNDKLLTYWDTVGDRLYKIRHSENISGVVQQLPIYEPPIDPALLVQAAAAGIDINSVIDDMSNASLPNYRYTFMVQKANEFCSDVKALGGALLSALEKGDAEGLALLRQGQETTLLNAILQMKQQQIDEANANLDALTQSQAIAQARYDYYNSRQYLNTGEELYLASSAISIGLQIVEATLQTPAASAYLAPREHIQGFASGVSYGGSEIGHSFKTASKAIGIAAGINNVLGNVANSIGGYDRRRDDWRFQAQSAQLEMAQIQSQITAANIRIAIAQTDYNNQQLQIDNSNALNDFMQNKYTNQQLYTWMSSQISGTYFQAYQLAYNMAKKAELCYRNELPFSTAVQSGFITPKYWDSKHQGLLAGEYLQADIRTMENAYLTDNKRTLELTKHVSLALLQPEQLIQLRATGSCTLSIPEDWYDLDYPGHYYRVIKSVSVSIPCVAGPYTTVPCTLSVASSFIRKTAFLSDSPVSVPLPLCNTIATSSGQNDNGTFEFSFRDERYLPFEGAGAISEWNISLTNGLSPATGLSLWPFDFNTIGDVILHIKYTAYNDSGLATARFSALQGNIESGILGDYASSQIHLPRYFSLKHEFPNEWYAFVNGIATSPVLSISINSDMFPFFCNNHNVTSKYLGFAKRQSVVADYPITVSIGSFSQVVATELPAPGSFTSLAVTPTTAYIMNLAFTSSAGIGNFNANIDDIYMVVVYQVTP